MTVAEDVTFISADIIYSPIRTLCISMIRRKQGLQKPAEI